MSRPSRQTRRLAATAVVLSLAGCGGAPRALPDADAGRVHLATDFDDGEVEYPLEIARHDRSVVRLVEVGGRPWISVAYDDDAWMPLPLEGGFYAPRHLPNLSTSAVAPIEQVVVVDGRPLTQLAIGDVAFDPASAPRGTFSFNDDALFVRLEEGEPRPVRIEHLVPVPVGEPDDDVWRVDVGPYAGEGMLVLPGTSTARTIAPGGERRLSFGCFSTLPVAEGEVRFRVLLDGRPVWSRTVDPGDDSPTGSFHFASVDLPPIAERATLRFETSGSFALTGFAAPMLGPVPSDEPPTDPDRPNLVVFLADTFRADGLSTQRRYADSPRDLDLANLERLRRGSIEFANSWSAATWTLPSHASLFASQLPRGHRVESSTQALPASVETLAESLRDAGYRTVAVTDGAYTSSAFGLAQGFESYVQGSRSRTSGLRRAQAVLDAHDGRPTFLFVQTYFTHDPLEPSDASRVAVGLPADGPSESELLERMSGDYARPEMREILALYRAQMLDFDAAFGDWLRDFDAKGWRANSHLLFTSDHGEAFGDHDWFRHIGPAYESQTRVPLLWSGPGVEPGVRRDATSTIDLAPTLLGLAGVAAPPSFRGRDLAEERDDALAFTSWTSGDDAAPFARARRDARLTATDGATKLMLDPVALSPRRAFDLATDPDELRPIRSADASWPDALARRVADVVDGAVAPDREPADLGNLASDLRDELESLGYLSQDPTER
ncbi:MAG: sulfatase [Planctomycetota bacterium]